VLDLLEVAFDLPNIASGEPPIIVSEVPEVGDRIPGDARRLINVGIIVAHHQVADTAKDGAAAVKPQVPGPGDGSESSVAFKQEQYMVQQVLRLEADDQWRIPVLFKYNGRGYGSFKTMC
jgi:hypothetical protein